MKNLLSAFFILSFLVSFYPSLAYAEEQNTVNETESDNDTEDKKENKKSKKEKTKKSNTDTSTNSTSAGTSGATQTAATSGSLFTAKTIAIGLGVIGGAAAAAGGGGGGGGGGAPAPTNIIHPETNDAADFVTAEAERNEAIGDNHAGMNAYAAYARGYDGRIWNRDASTGYLLDLTADGFIKVALIDEGVDLDHVDLDDNIAEGNLGARCTSSGCSTGGTNGDILDVGDWHGTAVAGIIASEKNDLGISTHGVAFNAKIVPINFDLTISGEFRSLNHAMNVGAQVINASYGLGTPIVDADEFDPTTMETSVSANSAATIRSILTASSGGQSLIQAYQRLVTTGTILVYAAGNEYFSELSQNAGINYYFRGDMDADINKPLGYDTINPEKYDFTGNIVAAIALNADKSIANFSNRCGVAAEWCIAAPGVLEYSTYPDNNIVSNISGTSFSAPAISGAIAIMMGAFPHLTTSEILQILYDTAEDLGDPGVDEIFGHGLVDLDAATDPTTGGWTLATTSDGSIVSNINNSHLSLSNVFGGNLNILQSGQDIMFLDGYKKNYYLPLNNFFKNNAYKSSGIANLYSRKNSKVAEYNVDISDDTSFSFSKNVNSSIDNNNDTGSSEFITNHKISDSEEVQIFFSSNKKPYEVTRALSYKDFASNNLGFTAISSTQINYNSFGLGFNNESNSFDLSFGAGTSVNNSMEFNSSTKYSDTSFVNFDYERKLSEKSKLGFSSNLLIENDTLLGSSNQGAFAFSDKSYTYSNSINGELAITDNLKLFGEYNLSITKSDAALNSLISVTDIKSDSFRIGAKNDKFGFMVSRPLAVTNGHLNMNIPVSINNDKSINFAERKFNIENSSRETNLEIFYILKPNLKDDDEISLNLIYRDNANHVQGFNETVGIATYKIKF